MAFIKSHFQKRVTRAYRSHNSKAIFHAGIHEMPLWEMAFLTDSLDFLFQPSKQFRLEELLDGDVQPIADFLDGGYRGAVVPPADDVVEGGLGDTAHAAQLIDGDVTLLAQFQYALFDSFADGHGHHLFLLVK
jgi:hypothetical protein